MRDKATAYSETVMTINQEMSQVMKEITELWLYNHGPPKTISGDQEFANPAFNAFLRTNGINVGERPGRRHDEIGIVESGHQSIRLVALKLLKDAKHSHCEMPYPLRQD